MALRIPPPPAGREGDVVARGGVAQGAARTSERSASVRERREPQGARASTTTALTAMMTTWMEIPQALPERPCGNLSQ